MQMRHLGLALRVFGLLSLLPACATAQILDGPDQAALETTRSGTVTQWQNPDNGTLATIVPKPAFNSGGTVCREFIKTITISGTQQQGYGTACRQTDGTWKLAPPAPRAAAEPVYAPHATPPQPRVVYVYPEPYYRPRPYYYEPYGWHPYRPGPTFGFGYGFGGHRHHR